ncbi:hypothetical protein GOARA_019_00030 [Gordonia araii NBRC 100433]|uniref:Knr4/Smi1-like domain-containing protein n=1 Tax=Gordonia araii NBRC 100433 TaxID=1073574 RepID=G7GYP6_9ACTN|nr:hypothetical protein [Gordonia araii]NNG98978.1 hypothetical protein [Gordonia araii NBRC 100433]GAB08721.1 hypothetical protein GOARA_019_00030 [Gordonia araii NBRC 100433]
MQEFDQAQLEAVFANYDGGVPSFYDLSTGDPSRLPESWEVVAASGDPEERKQAAFAQWNADFLGQLPRFAAAKEEALIDVRVIDVPDDDHPWMMYAFECIGGDLGVWTGFSPTTFGDNDPPFFDALPPSVQTFLRTVHAGFAAEDSESFGLTPPQYMMTFAEWMDFPEGIPDWENLFTWDCCDIVDSRRLVRVTGIPSDVDLFVSPDLEVGQAIRNNGVELTLGRLFDELDQLMAVRLER